LKEKRTVEDLSVDELRQLLIEKRRSQRQTRLDTFRRTGRIISVEMPAAPPELDELQSSGLADETQKQTPPRRDRKERRRSGMESLLVVVEVVAVIVLVFILFLAANLLRSFTSTRADSENAVSGTPTAIISAIVLPSGHTPPTSPGGAQPNYNEIPEHLRAAVQTMAEVPIPTPGVEQAQYIRIPAIGVSQVIIQGDGWEQLKKGVGQHIGSANPGEKGNLVLSAHNDIYGETFRHLDELKAGDEIYIRTSQREYTYIVDQIQYVDPLRVDLMAQTPETIVTLISCYPYQQDTQRIVVTAHLLETP
jgi:sortase A